MKKVLNVLLLISATIIFVVVVRKGVLYVAQSLVVLSNTDSRIIIWGVRQSLRYLASNGGPWLIVFMVILLYSTQRIRTWAVFLGISTSILGLALLIIAIRSTTYITSADLKNPSVSFQCQIAADGDACGDRIMAVPGTKDTLCLEGSILFDESAITSAKMTTDDRSGAGEINVELNQEATRILSRATGAETGKRIVIIIDGQVRSAPVITSQLSTGRLVIATPTLSTRECALIVHRLNGDLLLALVQRTSGIVTGGILLLCGLIALLVRNSVSIRTVKRIAGFYFVWASSVWIIICVAVFLDLEILLANKLFGFLLLLASLLFLWWGAKLLARKILTISGISLGIITILFLRFYS